MLAIRELLAYGEKHGSLNVPNRYNDGLKPHLGQWMNHQRIEYSIYHNTNGASGKITEDRIDKLNGIDFQWSIDPYKDDQWIEKFEELKAFKKKYNSIKVPRLDKNITYDDPVDKLGDWVLVQRVEYKRLLNNETSQMTLKRKELLDSIGFELSQKRKTRHEKWLWMYFKLYGRWVQFNTTSVSSGGGVSKKLIEWVDKQKKNYHKGSLPQDKIDLLNEIDLDWTIPPPSTWDKMFDELKAYHGKFGSTLINGNINPVLSGWTTMQRIAYANDELSVDKCRKLNNLRFDWDPPQDRNFHAMADRLQAFKRQYNTTFVPTFYVDDKSLAHWVHSQRSKYGSYFEIKTEDEEALIQEIANKESNITNPMRKLSPDTIATRVRRLLDIGFAWEPLEEQWMELYQRLVRYKAKHNTTLVPAKYPDDPELGHWVQLQRETRKGKPRGQEVCQRRIDLLDELGFEWDPSEAKWEQMFNELVKYKKEFGTANVSRYCKKVPRLGTWVSTQRARKKRGQLRSTRIALLDSIGFVWQ